MATRTVNQGFNVFLMKLTPTATESEKAKTHRASIKTCLETKFNMSRFFRTGSFGHGTSISGYSDVDYFAEIPTSKLKEKSATTLSEVRDALDERFPKTGVRVNCPAVLIPFGTDAKEGTEVIPANYCKDTTEGYKLYGIPDCEDGWMHSSPDAHTAYVKQIDDSLNGKVKPLIRFIKAWKYYRSVPIASFYLELRVTKYAAGKSSIDYDRDVKSVFSHLHEIDLADMQDPMGISGYIKPCSTTTKLDDAKSKLSTAKTRAQKAYDANKAGNVKEAFRLWNQLYNEKFPSYYY